MRFRWLPILFLFLLELVVPQRVSSKEKENVVFPKKEVLVHIEYGEKNGEFGYHAFLEGSPISPKAFDLDLKGNVYIADSGNNRIQVFDSKGTFLRKFDLKKSKRKFALITDIVISEKKNLVYVLMLRENIQLYNLRGQYIKTIPLNVKLDRKHSWTYAIWQPKRLEVDINGNIYISGFGDSLVKLNPYGEIVGRWAAVDHYIDTDANLYIMELEEKLRGQVTKYNPMDNILLKGNCNELFPSPVKDCRLPKFVDKYNRMYRMFGDMYVSMYTKQENVLLGVDLYVDEDGYYYKIDSEGNLYTIKEHFIRYLIPFK